MKLLSYEKGWGWVREFDGFLARAAELIGWREHGERPWQRHFVLTVGAAPIELGAIAQAARVWSNAALPSAETFLQFGLLVQSN